MSDPYEPFSGPRYFRMHSVFESMNPIDEKNWKAAIRGWIRSGATDVEIKIIIPLSDTELYNFRKELKK